MSSPEKKPIEVMDPSYWLPAENAARLVSYDKDDQRLKRKGKINFWELADTFNNAVNSWGAPNRSLLNSAPIDLQQLEAGTVIRFDREYLTGAGHPERSVAAKMIGQHEVAEAGFIGLSYERQPFNEPEPGRHWSYLYERQAGFGVIWTRPWGEKIVFGVRPKVERVPLGFKVNKFGVPSESVSIQKFEPVLLKFPVTAGAKVGISNQYHETKLDQKGEASNLFVVERFNAFDIYDS